MFSIEQNDAQRFLSATFEGTLMNTKRRTRNISLSDTDPYCTIIHERLTDNECTK